MFIRKIRTYNVDESDYRRAGSEKTAPADSVTSTAANMEGESRNNFTLIKINFFIINISINIVIKGQFF